MMSVRVTVALFAAFIGGCGMGEAGGPMPPPDGSVTGAAGGPGAAGTGGPTGSGNATGSAGTTGSAGSTGAAGTTGSAGTGSAADAGVDAGGGGAGTSTAGTAGTGAAGTGGRAGASAGAGGGAAGTGGGAAGASGAAGRGGSTGTSGAAGGLAGAGGATSGAAGASGAAGTGAAGTTGTGGAGPRICGGASGAECSPSEYCDRPPASCALPGASGLCSARPATCASQWSPVCGCDDATYANDCQRQLAGVSQSHTGACAASACTRNVTCEADEFCELPTGVCAAGTMAGTCIVNSDGCNLTLQPVCGCDGRTYGNDCERQAAGVAKWADGACSAAGCPQTLPQAGATCMTPGQNCTYAITSGQFANCAQRSTCGSNNMWSAPVMNCPAT
jgi:hypothetical protein